MTDQMPSEDRWKALGREEVGIILWFALVALMWLGIFVIGMTQ